MSQSQKLKVFFYNLSNKHKENVSKKYDFSYLLMFKKTCRKKPKDMRPILMPLKSSVQTESPHTAPADLLGTSPQLNPLDPNEKPDLSTTAEVMRNIRILLNKISKSNFARINDTLLNMFTYTQEILQEFSKLLFNKCIKEPNYIELYMELAHQMIKKFKSQSKEPANPLNFKKYFIDLCQRNLENPENDLLFNSAGLADDEGIILSKKARAFANIKLICELFNRGIMPDKFVIKNIKKLESKFCENNVENLILLIQGIGKKIYEYYGLEAKKPKLRVKEMSKEIFDDYIDKLVAFKNTDKISSRVKFLVSDLVKLRDTVWSLAFNKKPLSENKQEITAKIYEENKEVTAAKQKIEEQEKRKKSLNETNALGKNLDFYHKSRIPEKIRLRIQNIINEFLCSSKSDQILEIKETINTEITGLARGIIIGHMLIYGFTKKMTEFNEIKRMINKIASEKFIDNNDILESVNVILANYYDSLIDSPATSQLFKEILDEWVILNLIKKDQQEKFIAHAQIIQKQLESDYENKK